MPGRPVGNGRCSGCPLVPSEGTRGWKRQRRKTWARAASSGETECHILYQQNYVSIRLHPLPGTPGTVSETLCCTLGGLDINYIPFAPFTPRHATAAPSFFLFSELKAARKSLYSSAPVSDTNINMALVLQLGGRLLRAKKIHTYALYRHCKFQYMIHLLW